MNYRVIEAFSTPLRRFAEGMEVAAEEIDGHGAELWAALGKIAPLGPETAEQGSKSEPQPDPATSSQADPQPDGLAETA